MNWIILTLAIWSFSPTFAQVISQFSDLQDIKREISVQAIDSYLKKPNVEGVPGSWLQPLLEEKVIPSCMKINKPHQTSDQNESDEKTVHLEVLLVTEASAAPQGTFTLLYSDTYYAIKDKPIPIIYTATKPEIDYEKIKDYTTRTMQNLSFKTPEDQERYKKSLMIEGIVQSIPSMEKLSDQQISSQIASFIAQASKDEEERFHYLAMLANRLYLNYNDARNPGQNNFLNNPTHKPLPRKGLTQYQIFTGAAVQDFTQGGVCNDISAAIIKVAQNFYPDADLLTLNMGTHFGVIINDDKQIRVIDSGDQVVIKNQLALSNFNSSSNARISKLDKKGNLKEIAVLDTQLNQLLNKAYKLDRPILKSGANITDVFASVKMIIEKDERKRKELSLTAGTGMLSNSTVDVLVVKYETFKKKSHSYIGIGADHQLFYGKFPLHQIGYHLRTGVDRTLIRYVNPKLKLDYTTGLHMDARLTPGNLDGMGGALEIANRFHLETKSLDPYAYHVQGNAQVWNSLGPKDWGTTTGETSTVDLYGTMKAVQNLRFHLNQVVGTVSVDKPFARSENIRARGDASYQGSNVGQSVAVINGIEIRYPTGAQLYLFTGVETSDLKGYQTKHSLLVGPKGGKFGAEYQGNRGITVGTQVQGIGSTDGLQINAKAKMLFNHRQKENHVPANSP